MPASALHLYVHIPFCLHKCPYCDFNSHVRPDPPWEAYLSALRRELDWWALQPVFAGRPLASIYFGGGTPSLMSAGRFARFLEDVRGRFPLMPGAEISMEANPGATEYGRLSDYRACGINRLSIGVQSFSEAELRWLQRIHDAEEAVAMFHAARAAGFDNINLDLMYGLPAQSSADWMASLDRAIRCAPEHISCYQLSVEPHTGLARRHARRALPLPDEDASIHFFHTTRRRLAEAGFTAYELSNFARPGRRCRHNDSYWRYDDYIGIGAGACGKWDAADGGVLRYINERRPESYMDAVGRCGTALAEKDVLSAGRAAAEAMWLGLRRIRGVSRRWFQARFGAEPYALFEPALAPWRQRGCLEVTPACIRLAENGLVLADAVAADVLAEEPRAHQAPA